MSEEVDVDNREDDRQEHDDGDHGDHRDDRDRGDAAGHDGKPGEGEEGGHSVLMRNVADSLKASDIRELVEKFGEVKDGECIVIVIVIETQ